MNVIDKLREKLDASQIRQREGAGGKQLDYLETWYVIQQANEIFGYDAWSSETTELHHIGTIEGVDKYGKERYTAAYRATVRITVNFLNAGIDTVVREGSGFGNGLGKDELEAHELALKEAESDALKRAFMKFGNQFGLALYDKTRAGVEVPGKIFKNAAERNRESKAAELAMNDATNLDELKEAFVTYVQPLIVKLKQEGDSISTQYAAQLEARKDALKEQFTDMENAERN